MAPPASGANNDKLGLVAGVCAVRKGKVVLELRHQVAGEPILRVQVVHGAGEETLDLGGVEVDGNGAVHAGGLEKIGDKAGGDGGTGLVLLVLASIAVHGHDGGDTSTGRALQSGDNNQQLHEDIVDGAQAVHGVAHGLDDERIAATAVSP